jgi:hypothetical protein
LHDLVPGGTGYLVDLAAPETLRAVLSQAYAIVRDCPCADSGLLACHRCLLPFAGPRQGRLVSRVEATRQLEEILRGGSEDPDAEWDVDNVPPTTFDPETKIEQKFRAVLKERLKTLGATVKELPGSNGVSLDIVISGGRRWSLNPQEPVLNSKPDFLLRCDDPKVPGIAIFCDGWKYHASPLHNRLADDAAKRALLRDKGLLVLGLSWADLDSAATGDPAWFREAAVPEVMSKPAFQLRPGHIDLIRGGPMDLLASWIQHPDPEGHDSIGRALPFLMAPAAQVAGALDPKSNLASAALDILAGRALSGDGTALWAWHHDTVALACRLDPATHSTEVALVLDDHMLGVDHKAAWQDWRRVSNLLGCRQVGTEITVRSMVSARVKTRVETPPEAVPRVDSAWDPAIDAALPEELQFLMDVHGLGVDPPAMGDEVEGIPVGISWPAAKLAVELGLDAVDRRALESLGWRLVPADVDRVLQALGEGGR